LDGNSVTRSILARSDFEAKLIGEAVVGEHDLVMDSARRKRCGCPGVVSRTRRRQEYQERRLGQSKASGSMAHCNEGCGEAEDCVVRVVPLDDLALQAGFEGDARRDGIVR